MGSVSVVLGRGNVAGDQRWSISGPECCAGHVRTFPMAHGARQNLPALIWFGTPPARTNEMISTQRISIEHRNSGACVREEEAIWKQLRYLACMNHMYEIFLANILPYSIVHAFGSEIRTSKAVSSHRLISYNSAIG